MFRQLLLGLGLVSILACQKSTLSDSSTLQASAANSNLQLNTNDQFSFDYQFTGTAGTYDIIVTAYNKSATVYPTYSSLDIATIQGTFVTYNRLKLKPLHGIFIPGREGQPGRVLANSIVPMNDNLCSVMAIDVDLTNDSRVEVEFSTVVTANEILTVSAVPHQDNINPCDNSNLSSGTGTGLHQ